MKDIVRVGFGIKLLDDGLEGGIPKGNWVVITGEPGTGKSILCMHYAYAGLMSGDPVIYVTTEAEFRDVVRQARQFNMDFEGFNHYYLGDEKPEKTPQLVIIDIFSLLKTAKQLSAEAEEIERKRRYAALDIETLIAAVNEAYRVLGLTDERHKSPLRHVRLIVDSISAFWADKPAMARKYSYQFKIATHRENVTALLVSQYAMTTKSVVGDSKVIIKSLSGVEEIAIADLFRHLATSGEAPLRVNDCEVIYVDSLSTPSLDPNNLTIKWCRVCSVIRHVNSKPIYEVVLEDGRKLKLTEDHTLYRLNDNGAEPIRTCEVKVGDRIISANYDVVGRHNLDGVHVRVAKVLEVRECDGCENYVYDLSVEPFENYLADGVVVHNSTFGFGLEHIADGILHLWMDDVESVKEVRRYLIIKKMR
ncbi:MAG: ATPase domain-containing protein, partial [Sulfolobales archaeon]